MSSKKFEELTDAEINGCLLRIALAVIIGIYNALFFDGCNQLRDAQRRIAILEQQTQQRNR